MMSESQKWAEMNAKPIPIDWSFLYKNVKEGGSKQALSILTEAYQQESHYCETLVEENQGGEIIYLPLSSALAGLETVK